MACRTDSKVINEHEYSVTQWPAEKALLMKFKLGKILGPALALLASAMKTSDNEEEGEDNTMRTLSDSLDKLFEKNSPEEIVKVMKESIIGVSCDGYRITESRFTELFSGDDLMEIYQVFIFVLQVNYGNLFKGQFADRLLARVQESL